MDIDIYYDINTEKVLGCSLASLFFPIQEHKCENVPKNK